MSAPDLPANIARIVLERRWQDVVAHNVFYVWREGPHGPETIPVLLDALERWWNTGGIGIIAGPSGYDPQDVSLGARVALTAIGYVKVLGLGVATRFLSSSASSEANVPAPQAAVIVRWLTGYYGRGRTGRSYHGLVTSGMYAGSAEGLVSAGVAEGLTLAYELWISTLTTGTGVPGEFAPVLVHSKPVSPSDSSDGLWDFIVDAEVMDRRVRTQRRRVPRTLVAP